MIDTKPTFLTAEQIWGDKALDIMKRCGAVCEASDLAKILGAVVNSRQKTVWWSASANDYGDVRGAYDSGYENCFDTIEQNLAGRPALLPSFTSSIRPSKVRTSRTIKKFKVVQYGEYPQIAVPAHEQSQLSDMLSRGKLRTTGKKYTFNVDDTYTDFSEYEYNGNRYVCVPANPYDSDSRTYTGEIIKENIDYWVRVTPIEWLVDPSGWWVALNGLFSGMPFDSRKVYDGNFANTEIAKYLKNTFAKQMQPNTISHDTNDNHQQFTNAVRRITNGVTIIDEPMPIHDQIKFYVDTGKSFMLHGPSGIGKTARIEAIDPALTAIPLWNGVLPEDIVGKVRYPNGTIAPLMTPNETGAGATEKPAQGGVWVAPDWYNELCRKCAAEPDKQHVLFIDEVTNAKPTTQSLIFHIVLKKSISPSQGKLPKNAVVVLAGNEKADSNAAYNMPSPLFRRMSGHVRLKCDIMEWMQWASEKSRKHPNDVNRQNIHPFIIHFLASNERVFYSNYDEEEPNEWAIDPRGWEQISDIIYDNKNVLRRELIENKIGRENATALLAFAREPIITLDDVLSDTYTPDDIPRTTEQRFATMMGLRYVDGRNLKKVRDFISRHLGNENLAIFDSLWASQSPECAIQIANIRKLHGR